MRKILALAGALALLALPTVAQTNLLVCGDASTCPNQRGTASVGGDIVASAVPTLDFWYGIGGTATALNVSAVAPVAGSTIQGVSLAMKMQRKSGNAILLPLSLGQVLDTDASTSLQGKTVCLSFDSMKGSGFSANLAAFTWGVYSGTGTAQGYASMVAGTWTGTATVASGTVTATALAQTTSSCFAIPGTATEVGLNFAFTPVGTAGADDWIELAKIQMVVVNSVPAAAVAPPYVFRTKQTEFELALRRALVINEPAASVSVANGSAVTTGYCQIVIPLPVPMRAVPTVAFGGTALGATTWALISASATPIVLASTWLVQSALGVNTAQAVALKATGLSTPFTAGLGCQLVGAGGGSSIIVSAELL